ncbi:proteoglycan 4 isoform X2 [Mixophyes fleayi]|uniref:proteoglycan 4 isoform X2 n=1 Tax=Mixophyes fleayi TaxID=3061075 RepID=UPI003F4DEEA2
MELKMYSTQLVLCFIIYFSTVSAQKGSCKGRCHEGFIRGQTCDCDPGCTNYGKCCPDFESNCLKPTQRQPSAPPSSPKPIPDATDNSPEPTKKTDDEMPEDTKERPSSSSTSKSSLKSKDKKRPPKKSSKIPKKKKTDTLVESEEEIQESEENVASSSFSSSASSSSVKGSKTTQKLSRKNQKKNKPEDGNPDPDNPESDAREPNRSPKDKDNKPKKPKTTTREGDDDPTDPESPPEEPNQKLRSPNDEEPKIKEPPSDDKDGRPKNPKVKDDDIEDPDKPPKDPSLENSPPPSPGDIKKKPKKTKKTRVEEDTEINEDNEDNTSSSNLKNTKKRSPGKANKNPKKAVKPTGITDDPSQNPSPAKEKKKPISTVKNKKKVSYSDEDTDEPSKPGKGKNPKDITKRKKKIGSEEERQETVESEFSSSSQSSSSHSRSKSSTRRLTGKNKKKKIPEEPEEPLRPPKPKKDKDFPPTPEPTFSDGGSGDDGSGMDFLPTTMAATTLINQFTTAELQTTVVLNQTGGTVNPSSKPQTESNDVASTKATQSTPNLLSTEEQLVKNSTATSPITQSSTSYKVTPSTPNLVSTEERPANTSTTLSSHTQSLTSYKTTASIPNVVSTEEQPAKASTTMSSFTQSSTPKEKDIGLSMATNTPVPQMSTLKTPKDQSTTDSSAIIHTTISEKTLQETTNTMSYSSQPGDSTKQTPLKDDNDNYTTSKQTSSAQYSRTTKSGQTEESPGPDSGIPTESLKMDYSTTNTNMMAFSTSATPRKMLDPFENQTVQPGKSTTEQSVKLNTETTEHPNFSSPAKSTVHQEQRSPPTKSTIYGTTTKHVFNSNTKTPTVSMHPTKIAKPTGLPTAGPIDNEEMENNIKTTKPQTVDPYHVCDLLKDEATKLKISDNDLQRITDICMEIQQQYPLVSTPASETKQPNVNDGNIPTRYPYMTTHNQPPGSRIIQIMEEINRRMNISPMPNLSDVPAQNIPRSTVWLLLLNKIKSSHDLEKNLCIGKPADGMTTLQNGSMVVFRGNYFWMLNQGGVTESPRKISEVWGIPSPIDTVFTRCNCGAKTFFFKGPLYWRFTNDIMDHGYPKEIAKGFNGLRDKVTAVLPVAGFQTRPESVYFFKRGGNVQKYTFRQEQSKKCTKKKPSIQYPIYSQRVETVKYRYPRDIVRHRIVIHRTFSNVQQPLGILHEETSVRSTLRGVPSNIISAISLSNPKKQDGFDYFVFTKDKYYNINMSSKVAVKPPPESEQKTSKDWYKCKE